MEILVESILYGLAVFALYMLCFLIARPIHRARFNKNRPSGQRRHQLIAEVQELRKDGLCYNERLAYLLEKGLRRDVADELLGEAEQ